MDLEKNMIKIDLNLLDEQQEAIEQSNIEEKAKQGLLEMIDTIKDIAEDFKQFDDVQFVMVIE